MRKNLTEKKEEEAKSAKEEKVIDAMIVPHYIKYQYNANIIIVQIICTIIIFFLDFLPDIKFLNKTAPDGG